MESRKVAGSHDEIVNAKARSAVAVSLRSAGAGRVSTGGWLVRASKTQDADVPVAEGDACERCVYDAAIVAVTLRLGAGAARCW